MTIKSPTISPHRKGLTERQQRIANDMRADGYAVQTIALRLGVTAQSVSAHTRGIQKAGSGGW